MKNLQLIGKNLVTKTFNLFEDIFAYDQDQLSIIGQKQHYILANLSYALLHRSYILLTLKDNTNIIGKIIKVVPNNKIIVKNADTNAINIVNITDIFRTDIDLKKLESFRYKKAHLSSFFKFYFS